jgi:hypothetical protein
LSVFVDPQATNIHRNEDRETLSTRQTICADARKILQVKKTLNKANQFLFADQMVVEASVKAIKPVSTSRNDDRTVQIVLILSPTNRKHSGNWAILWFKKAMNHGD